MADNNFIPPEVEDSKDQFVPPEVKKKEETFLDVSDTPTAKPSRSLSGVTEVTETVEKEDPLAFETQVSQPSSLDVQDPTIIDEQAWEGGDPLFLGGERLKIQEDEVVAKKKQSLIEDTFTKSMNIAGRRGIPVDKEDIPKSKEELDLLSDASRDYEILISSKLSSHIPDDLKIKSALVDKERQVVENIKSGNLTREESNKERAKLLEIEKQLILQNNNKKLFDPITGETVDQDKATPEAIEYDGLVQNLTENKYSDLEDAYQASEKAIHLYDYYDEELDKPAQIISGAQLDPSKEITYRDLLELPGGGESIVNEQEAEKARLLKSRWIDSKANVEAISRAIMLNEDPSQIDRGFGGGAGFNENVAKGFMDAIGKEEVVTGTEGDFATRFVGVIRDAGKDNILTKAQVANAEQTFTEKLGYGVGASVPIMAEIALTTAATEGVATEAVVAKNIKRFKDLFGTSKAGKLIANTIEQGTKGAIAFAPTEETAATGVGEGVAQGLMDSMIPENLIGGKYGKLLNYAIRTVGGGIGESIQEVSGQYIDALNENGYDANKAFYDAFGRTPEERWENLALIGTTSLLFSGAFNSSRLVMTKKALQDEIDNGNVPQEDVKETQEIVDSMEEKIASEEEVKAPKPDITTEGVVDTETEIVTKPKEDAVQIRETEEISVDDKSRVSEEVVEKEPVKKEEEKEITPTEDVKPVETVTEQEARSVEQPDTEQEEVLEALPKDATVEEKRKYAIDTVLSGQIIERPTGRNIGIQAREDFKMPNKEINKAIADIKKGNLETAPAKKLIDKLVDSYDLGGIPVIEGTGGKSVRRKEIPIEYFKEGIDEYNRKREYTDSELKEINDIQDELVEDHDSYFKSLTEEEQIEKLDYYERINKEEVSEDTKGTESKSDVVSKTERSPKETAKTKAELIAEANNLKEGEDTRKIMKKAKAAGLSKDSDLIDIISPKAKVYRKSQEKLQKATRDALGIKEDFNSDNIFLNEDITDNIEEWKGEKLPSGTLKKSILEVNKTGDVSKGLDIMKDTDWYKDQSEEKQYEFEYDYKKSLGEDMTDVQKPTAKREFVRKTERSVIKDKISTLKQGIKEGRRVEAKDLKELRNSLNSYIKETLKDFNLSTRSRNKMSTMIKNVNRKNYDSLIDKVDSEFSVLESEDKARTISDIHKFLTSPKTIIGKKGKRKVGKVPIEIQQYIKAFDTSSLGGMTRSEVKKIYADLKGVVNEGKKKTKAIDRAINAQKRRIQGTNFLELHRTNKGDSYTVSGKQNVIDELSNKNRVAIINGQLISSKTKFEESEKELLERSEDISSVDDLNSFIEDNPDFDFEDVTILKTQSQKSAQHNRKKGIGVTFSKIFNPIYRTANLRLNLQPLEKGSKILRKNSDKIAKDAVKAENRLNIESEKKKEQLVDGLEKIYKKHNPKFLGVKTRVGVKTRAKGRLSEEADVDISNDIELFTNSNLIDLYLMSQNPEGKEKLVNQEFDVEAINKYMEDNPDLKEYSEFLSDWYNTTAKESYTDIHEKVTKTKFPEGKYYPLYTDKTFDALGESGGIMDDNLNVNPMKAFAGSMVSRVKNKSDLDVYIGAYEKATHYIDTMERVKQFDELAEDVSNTFNKATNSEIIKKVGIEKFNNIIDHLSIVITGKDPNRSNKGDSIVNTLMGIKIFGSLGFKTASIPTQAMSFTHFMQSAEVPAKEWLKGFVPVTKGEKEAAKAFATSDYVKNRFKGGNIDREYNRFLKGGNIAGELLKSTTKLSMFAIRVGDISAVISGGSALSVAIYRREIKAGKSHEEAIETAVEEASVESETAQQSSLPSQTSYMQRNQVGRLFTAFKTSQIAAKNKMILSAKTLLSDSDLTPEEKTHHISNMLYFAGASVTFAVAKRGFQLAALKSLLMLAKGAMSEDDEKELKRAGYETLMDNTGSMLDGFGYEGFLLNVLLNKLKGDEWKNAIPLMQQILDIAEGGASGIKFLTDMYANGKEWDDLSDFEKSEIHRLFAVSGIKKQFDSWTEAIRGDKELFDAIMNLPTKEKKEKYKKNQNDWIWNQMEGRDNNKTNKKNKKRGSSRQVKR